MYLVSQIFLWLPWGKPSAPKNRLVSDIVHNCPEHHPLPPSPSYEKKTYWNVHWICSCTFKRYLKKYIHTFNGFTCGLYLFLNVKEIKMIGRWFFLVYSNCSKVFKSTLTSHEQGGTPSPSLRTMSASHLINVGTIKFLSFLIKSKHGPSFGTIK